MRQPLWLISEIWWDSGLMLVPTIDLITVSDIWSTTIQDRLFYHTINFIFLLANQMTFRISSKWKKLSGSYQILRQFENKLKQKQVFIPKKSLQIFKFSELILKFILTEWIKSGSIGPRYVLQLLFRSIKQR